MTEDEMVGWHHIIDGHEFEQALGVGEGQGGLGCCSPQGHKESDITQQMNNNNKSNYPTPYATSGNHKSDLFFYELVWLVGQF